MEKRLDDKDVMLLRCAEQRMTFREMAETIMVAPSAVHYRVAELQKMGLLTKPNHKARSVILTELGASALRIPSRLR